MEDAQVLAPDPESDRPQIDRRKLAALGGRRPHLVDRRTGLENSQRRSELEAQRRPLLRRQLLQPFGGQGRGIGRVERREQRPFEAREVGKIADLRGERMGLEKIGQRAAEPAQRRMLRGMDR